MGFHADVEVEDHLRKAGGLDLLEHVRDVRGRAQQNRVICEILRLYFLQPFDHVDEVAVARRRSFGVSGQGRNHALLVISNLARAGGVLLRLVIGEVREVTTHQPARGVAELSAALVIEISDLLEPTEAHRRRERRDNQTAT